MFPDLIPVRRHFPNPKVDDVTRAMQTALGALDLGCRIGAGMTVGIPVGSRGIRNIDVLLREAARHVRSLGATPVVVAAMGSHGGGTPAGQLEVLRSLGVTAESVGEPVHGNDEAVVLGTTPDGLPVYFDTMLAKCDALLVINRVKPHTSFHGPLESGLVKMLVVGCGKSIGARQFHSFGPERLSDRLRRVSEAILSTLPVIGGIAILENGQEETADLVAIRPENLIATEMQLLERTRELLPRLPVNELDLLIVDEMGKNISGTGMDTNVIGRVGIPGVADGSPHIRRLVVLDLSEGSHGNANGVGLADLVTRRLANKIDFRATYLNTLTATFLERAKLPMTLESDRAVIEAALQTLGSPSEPRIIRIKNTLELSDLLVSESVLREIRLQPETEVIGGPVPWPFDERGNLM